MKFSRILFLCALSVLAVSGFSLDRNAFTFTHYDLNLQIEPEQQRLGVRGKITLRNDSGLPQKTVALQISSSLNWRSIKVNGEAAQFVSQVYTSDIDHTGALSEAIVSLPRQVPPKGTVELEVGYEGVLPLDTTRLTRIGVPEGVARHSDWDQISSAYSAVRGIGYVAWYPISTEAASLSEGNAVFQTVGEWKLREQQARLRALVCLSGPEFDHPPSVLMNNPRTGDSPARSDSASGFPSNCGVHDFTQLGYTVPTFAAANFARYEAPPVSVYCLPDHASGAAVFTKATQAVAPFVREWFGPAKDPLAIIDVADADAAPFESGPALLASLQNSDPKLAEMLLAHQLTHSAFHSPRLWIDEGMAHFAQALWREQQAGRQAALDYMGLHRSALATAEKVAANEKDSPARQSLISTTLEEYYRSKAMFIWWMLRDMVGDASLKEVIAAYRPQEDNAPSYVQKLIRAKSHRDLEWFFDDWVYRDRGLPDFHIVSAYTRQMLKGTYLVTISVENQGMAGAEVPVRVRLGHGEITSKVEVHAKSTATVRVEAPSSPEQIIVNDGSVPESNTENNTFRIQEPQK